MEFRDDAIIKVLAPLAFRAADKFFKFTSWMIILSLLKYADGKVQSAPLHYFYVLATLALGVALFGQAFYLSARDPEDFKIPPQYHTASRVIQVILGFGLLLLMGSPLLYLDTIIDNLVAIK